MSSTSALVVRRDDFVVLCEGVVGAVAVSSNCVDDVSVAQVISVSLGMSAAEYSHVSKFHSDKTRSLISESNTKRGKKVDVNFFEGNERGSVVRNHSTASHARNVLLVAKKNNFDQVFLFVCIVHFSQIHFLLSFLQCFDVLSE